MEPYADTVEQYLTFAEHTRGESPCFEQWSRGVADDAEVAAWVSRLPGLKKQPNLVFAAARWHGVPAPGPYAALREALLADDAVDGRVGGPIRSTIMARSTQTNEVGRLATLLPAFSLLADDQPAGPVAVLEVGASAGLNLFPDRWGYAWATRHGPVHLGPEPRLPCDVDGPAPLPVALPEVAWRGGIDLNPLDVRDDDAMRWLDTLIWPEEDERRTRLARAVEVARAEPPSLVRGDLVERLPELVSRAAAEVGGGAHVVVFHTAVIAYLDDTDRARFQTLMTDLVAAGACHWVSNEGPRVLPEVTATGEHLFPDRLRGRGFVLGVDGRAVALTHGHGQYLHWLT